MTISLKPRHSVWLDWHGQIVASQILQNEIDERIAATVGPLQFKRELEFLKERGQTIADIADQFDNYQEFQNHLQTQILNDA